MEITIKSELASKFTKLTGMTVNIDTLIANATTQAEKEDLYIRLIWMLPDGNVDELSTEAAELKTYIIDKLQDADKLNISANDNFEAAIAALKSLTEACETYEATIKDYDEDVKKFYVDDYQALVDAKSMAYSSLIVANRTNDVDQIDAIAEEFSILTQSVATLQNTVTQAQLAKDSQNDTNEPGDDNGDSFDDGNSND